MSHNVELKKSVIFADGQPLCHANCCQRAHFGLRLCRLVSLMCQPLLYCWESNSDLTKCEGPMVIVFSSYLPPSSHQGRKLEWFLSFQCSLAS